jgi:DNA processing protein
MAFADDIGCWIALAAGGVRGVDRSAVLRRGACRALADGRVGETSFDAVEAAARAKLAMPFLARGGRVLGGPDAASLGRLAERSRAPLVAFARGELPLTDGRPRIAIVGSRQCTERGRYWAGVIARAVTRAGGVVVSGGAVGIDTAAHDAALDEGGSTIVVLGEPVRRDGGDERPALLRRALAAAPDRATTVTMFGPWVGHSPGLFASRNHWIAALSDRVVIVEGSAASGTRHTAAAARALGVPVLCPTGDPKTSQVPMELLLKTKEAEWLDVNNDLERQLVGPAAGTPSPLPRPRPPPRPPAPPRAPDPPIVKAIKREGGRMLVDALLARAPELGIPARDLLSQIAILEMEGQLRREGASLVCGDG